MNASSRMSGINWRASLLPIWAIGVALYFGLMLNRFEGTLWFRLLVSLSLIASYVALRWSTSIAYRMTNEVRWVHYLSVLVVSLIAALSVGALLVLAIGRLASFLTPYNMQGEFASLTEAKFRDAIRYLTTAMLPWAIAATMVSRVTRAKEDLQKLPAFVVWSERAVTVLAVVSTIFLLARAW
jgi:hypothetical protein